MHIRKFIDKDTGEFKVAALQYYNPDIDEIVFEFYTNNGDSYHNLVEASKFNMLDLLNEIKDQT